MNVKAQDIKLALAQYHPKDFFIPECKTCSTYFPNAQGLLIFDGIAITRSYTQPCITGYEIKVSRGDFKQDAKYHLYLQYCNEFYFVVPVGLLKKEEIPDNMGLIYYYPETGKLIKKKKALHREIDEPVDMYKYIIYSRIEQDRIPFYEDKAEYAKAYLEDKSYKRRLGIELGSTMAKELSEATDRLERLNRAEEELNTYKEIQEVLHKHGISTWRDDVAKELDKCLSANGDVKGIELVADNMKRCLERLNEMIGKE